MLKQGIEIRCRVEAPEVEWWIGRFGKSTSLFPAGICRHLTADIDFEHLFALEKVDIRSELTTVLLAGQSDGDSVYEASRSIVFHETSISMDYLRVEEAFRRRRIGSKLLENAYTLACKLHLARLSVKAMDVGSYVWARMGFLATEKSWSSASCRGKITEKIGDVSDLDWRIKDDLYKIVSADDPTGLWDLVDQQKIVNSTTVHGLRRPLGEVLLIESEATWRGTLELSDTEGNDSPHIERLLNYLGSR